MKLDSLLTGVLKTLAVIALISLAGVVILGEVAVFNGRYHHPTTWHWHAGAGLLTAFCLCASYLLIRPARDSDAMIYCQRCHTLGGHTQISPYRPSVSSAAWHFGGVLFSIFYSASRKEKYRCRSCSETFEAHTNTSRRYRILFLLMLGLAINFFWAQIDDFRNQ